MAFAKSRLFIVVLAAACLVPGVLHAGKPLPRLNSSLCASLGGAWANNTCTIADGAWGQATSSFMIPNAASLVIRGDGAPSEGGALPCTFLIDFGVTIENQGFINVETDGEGGLCNLGTLKNSGIINVANTADYYFGLINFATIISSGTIDISNSGWQSSGIFNLPHIPDAPYDFDTILPTITNSGSITIANSGGDSTGFVNQGAVSNTGTITASADIYGIYGFSNEGTFTNEVSGTLVNLFGTVDPDFPAVGSSATYGFGNFDGTMINHGTVTNEGAIGTNGWAMLTYGTLNNHGILLQTGGVLVNYGTVHNWGLIDRRGGPDYPHNRGICIDEADEDGNIVGSGCQ